MVAQVLGLTVPLDGPPDVADALALAVCHLTTVPLRRAVGAALLEQSATETAGRRDRDEEREEGQP